MLRKSNSKYYDLFGVYFHKKDPEHELYISDIFGAVLKHTNFGTSRKALCALKLAQDAIMQSMGRPVPTIHWKMHQRANTTKEIDIYTYMFKYPSHKGCKHGIMIHMSKQFCFLEIHTHGVGSIWGVTNPILVFYQQKYYEGYFDFTMHRHRNRTKYLVSERPHGTFWLCSSQLYPEGYSNDLDLGDNFPVILSALRYEVGGSGPIRYPGYTLMQPESLGIYNKTYATMHYVPLKREDKKDDD